MTCRDFIDAAEALTPLESGLVETRNEQLSAHARECTGCGKWMESQRLLGNALQVLRARTAQREAGPKVEQAVLQAFRRQGFEPVAAVAPERAAPAAWKLSRFFELSAYAAVAAALIVGIFLGARMWRDQQAPQTQIQARETLVPQPANPQAAMLSYNGKPSERVPTEVAQKLVNSAKTKGAISSGERRQTANRQSGATTAERQGFVALMFCDPLICSGEEQVIRMELPGSASASAEDNGSQPVIADVVIGDDGLVRAMRIVNQ